MSENAKNGSEAKFYPNTTVTIQSCLLMAKQANDNPGLPKVLTQKTTDRLNAIEPLYNQAKATLGMRKANHSSLYTQRAKARVTLHLNVSHFLQVFNMGIKRGKYSFADRVLFGMDAYSETLPGIKNDGNLGFIAEKIADAEAKRIADGKPAMSNPSGAEVQAALTTFNNLNQLAMKADAALADQQKALRGLHKEARNVVKRVWREVETYYSEGNREHMRKMAREWGVIYARKGGEKKVTGTVLDAATGLPVAAAKLKFENGKNKTVTDLAGKFTLITNLMHKQTLIATRQYYDTAEVIVELKEGVENKVEVRMERNP